MADALALGISTVYQEVNLLPNLSVAHNLYLGREPERFGCIHWQRIKTDAEKLLQRFRLDIDVTKPLSVYSIAVQQLVAIARGVDCSARVLVLDEPTASLDAGEVELLFSILRTLKSQGIAIVFVTHFLNQVYAVSDRITVLRNGKKVGTFVTAMLPRSELIQHMLGKELQALEHKQHVCAAPDVASHNLAVAGLKAANGIHDIAFSAGKGEALGLSGLLGSGRTELCEALFGLSAISGGEIKIGNQLCNVGSPAGAIRLGMALCPEDRKSQGIVAQLSIRENIMLALQALRGWWKPISRKEQQTLVAKAIGELKIDCPHAEKPTGELSGGNQQKVILARALVTNPGILILDEPTRGIDIGAHAEIITLIRNLCRQGLTVIVASSELDELIAFSDKVLVMRDRTRVAELTGDDINEQQIMSAMAQAG